MPINNVSNSEIPSEGQTPSFIEQSKRKMSNGHEVSLGSPPKEEQTKEGEKINNAGSFIYRSIESKANSIKNFSVKDMLLYPENTVQGAISKVIYNLWNKIKKPTEQSQIPVPPRPYPPGTRPAASAPKTPLSQSQIEEQLKKGEELFNALGKKAADKEMQNREPSISVPPRPSRPSSNPSIPVPPRPSRPSSTPPSPAAQQAETPKTAPPKLGTPPPIATRSNLSTPNTGTNQAPPLPPREPNTNGKLKPPVFNPQARPTRTENPSDEKSRDIQEILERNQEKIEDEGL